jgi:arylsulfotransferase ASST
MHKILLLTLLLTAFHSFGQLSPAEGSRVNYRLIGFSFLSHGNRMLQVAAGNYDDETAFEKNIIIAKQCTGGKMIVEVPSFGSDYTWRMVTGEEKSRKAKSAFHHFSTLPWFNTDSSKSRLRIISNSGEYNGNYVFVDATKTMYDMDGKPVWFLPEKNIPASGNITLRDLKITPHGSISYIFGEVVRDVDYNGNILWEGPHAGSVSGDTSEHFHHEFTQLSNGHYMAMGMEPVAWPIPFYHSGSLQAPDASVIKGTGDTLLQKMQFGTLIEYDSEGRVAWSWKSSGYFRNSDLYRYYSPDGKFPVADVHENAFFFDEKKKVIYVGFRNISRIVKIKYPEGNILAVYGKKFTSAQDDICNELFCGQHSIRINANGDIYLFNNNAVAIGAMPNVLVLKETGKKNSLEKLWQYDCTLNGMSESEVSDYNKHEQQVQAVSRRDSSMSLTMRLTSGGNAVELPGGSFLVTMSGSFGKIFIVNKNKKICWSAVPEVRIFSDAAWAAVGSYRASIITRPQLQKLIRNAK